jgi:Ca2+-binding RTX toxin-like protein
MSERSLALAPSAAAALAVEGDILDGGEGDDRLFAAAGSQLIGGIGNDVLVAGDGAQLTGGAGFDTFVLDWLSGDAVITDFSTAGGDVVDLGTTLDAAQSDDEGLNPFATGHLRMVARDGGTAIVFDRDGAGSGAAAEIGFVAGTTVAEVGEALVASGSPETRLDPTRTSFIAGSDEDDEIDGTAAGDTVSTRYGNDVVRGHGGDDELAGG